MSLKEKVAIVTGSSSGIGAAIAKKFASEGALVTIVGRNQTKLDAVTQQVTAVGTAPLVLCADVTKEDDARRIISETIKKFNRIDILINNAGIGGSFGITDDKIMENYDKLMGTNLRSVVFLTHLAAPHIIETKGNIINMSSVAGKIPIAKFLYATTKAALDHFTRCVALELAAKGVRVNAINPGPVYTDILENTGLDKIQQEVMWNYMKSMTALKRIADAEEVADLALFLASDKARSITGSTYLTDNGVSLRPSSMWEGLIDDNKLNKNV